METIPPVFARKANDVQISMPVTSDEEQWDTTYCRTQRGTLDRLHLHHSTGATYETVRAG